MARTPLLAGNWKMNLTHLEAVAHVQKLARALAEAKVTGVEVAVLAPFTDLRSVQTLVDGEHLPLGYGAQDVSPHPPGPHTGDVSASMLARLGCGYVVVGHSERRAEHGETDAVVAAKVAAAAAAGLVPILCVGEDAAVRAAGGHVEHTVAQLSAAAAGLPAERAGQLVVAYEPVWAIGTGAVAGPEQAQEMAAALRAGLGGLLGAAAADRVRVLYGGSMKPDNAADILGQPDVDGGLVGGASLSVADFVAICRAAIRS